MEELYQITLSYACAGITIKNEVVVKTAPIFGWMKGKHTSEIKKWISNKKGTIIKIN